MNRRFYAWNVYRVKRNEAKDSFPFDGVIGMKHETISTFWRRGILSEHDAVQIATLKRVLVEISRNNGDESQIISKNAIIHPNSRKNKAESDNDSTRKPSETASNGSLVSNAGSIFDPRASWVESEDGSGGGNVLPADVATVVRLDAQHGVVANLANAVSSQLVSLVRRRCEAHGANVVWSRVRSDGVRAGLPDAGCEVETRHLVWDPVPVQDELRVG